MLNRRTLLKISAAVPLASISLPSFSLAQEVESDEAEFLQLENPPIASIDAPVKFGYNPATPEQIAKVNDIVKNTKGSTPIDVAESFITRFYKNDRDAISQWPAPAEWNPLIVRFFNEATSLKVNNDMVDWCAAFANWCIKRAGKHSTNSAASQSFIKSANRAYFRRTNTPKHGDLVVWTCYDMNGKSLGLGHVGFYYKKIDDIQTDGNYINILSGNTASDGRSSLICIKPFSIRDRNVFRTVNKVRVPAIMRLNAYLEII